ncbi:hypothetical protein Ahy_B06g084177 isoform B [Arachis hypogaea]|uniref:Aminotransferase-like plant mobile domain-containing protein n=1 Tax=Arachis hypogaea TaxID=3818 RepID=A0A444YR77_ARAHY|nr:hypothetical protein Ahy_B06g084177 isoform B [Arachis hypogaea]
MLNVSQIPKISGQTALINALVERWNPVTHTFYLPIGENTITLEDVALILGLQETGLPVTGPTNSNYGIMVQEYLMNFGVAPTTMERYTRCHIMSLFGTTLFADKFGAGVHWKFLPLLRNISESGHIVGDQHVLPTCTGLCVGPRNMIAKIWMGR